MFKLNCSIFLVHLLIDQDLSTIDGSGYSTSRLEALFILTQRNKKSKIKRFFLPQAISFLRKAFNSRENENFYWRRNVNKTKGYASALTSLPSVAGAGEAFQK